MTTRETDWHATLRFDVAHAEKMLTTSGSLMPMFVVRSDEGHFMIATPFENEMMKQAALNIVRTFAIAYDAYAVTQVHEAWISSIVTPEGASREDGRRIARNALPPSQDPKRKEVVIAVAVYRGEDQRPRQMWTMHEIERNGRGKVTGLGLNTVDSEGEIEGRISDLLTPLPVSEPMRAAARDLLKTLPEGVLRPVRLRPANS